MCRAPPPLPAATAYLRALLRWQADMRLQKPATPCTQSRIKYSLGTSISG